MAQQRGRQGAEVKIGQAQLEFSQVKGMRIQAAFDEPEVSSDAGALLLREVAEANGIIDQMAAEIRDPRAQAYVRHTLKSLLSQRVIQICQGYEDANDCNPLRDDLAIKVASGQRPQDNSLGSQPTMSRLENSVGLRDLIRLFYVFVDNFVASYPCAPESIVIDMDPTLNRVYGDQQLALFNGHYDSYGLMPFHVYEGQTGRLIATLIRPGKTPRDTEIIGLLKRIVRRIRQRFPDTVLIFRADSHHTKPAVLDWLEQHEVHYVLGLAINPVLRREVQALADRVERVSREQMCRYRGYHSFQYAAGTWSRKRRVVARVEGSAKGVDARFIVTDLKQAGAKYLYDTVYCGRGNAELMIKEHKCFLKSSRTSCHTAYANQLRLHLHSAAYVIMHALRTTVLRGTELANATFATIQLRLLKIAARVECGKTYVRFHMPATCPTAHIFARAVNLVHALRT
jgi:hypothetical protein